MIYPVTWSPEASDEYAELLKYIEEKWGIDSALNLLNDTDRIVDLLSSFPNMYPSSKKRGIRIAVINKHTSLIYRTKNNKIELLHFWDNRRNPESLDEMIK